MATVLVVGTVVVRLLSSVTVTGEVTVANAVTVTVVGAAAAPAVGVDEQAAAVASTAVTASV
jgi:hypothetical protein